MRGMKMKTEMYVHWDADTEFASSPRKSESALQRFSGACLRAFQSVKEKISGELALRFATVRPEIFKQAVNEAAALAASTSFPTLFFPTLAEEKVSLASKWEVKQQMILQRSSLRAA